MKHLFLCALWIIGGVVSGLSAAIPDSLDCEGVSYDAFYANIVIGEAESGNPGYTGDGYANTTWGKGNYVEFSNVVIDKAGNYLLEARFTNGKDVPMTSDVVVNGEVQGTFIFDPTGDWANWQADTLTVTFKADTNVVQIISTQGQGVPNLDRIKICETENQPDEIQSNIYDAFYANIVTGGAETGNSGYTGDGYANTDWGEGTYVEFNNVFVDTAGTYFLTARYANGKDESMTSSIIVNGTQQAILECAPTEKWNAWVTKSKEITLDAGINIIQIKGMQNQGVPNLDRIEITSSITVYDGYHALVVEGEVENENAGYTGDGYANTTWGAGNYVEFSSVHVDTAGNYCLTARYANGKEVNMTSDVVVNGENLGTLQFASTGGWSNWETDTLTITLTEDINVVQILSTQGQGVPNLDKIEISKAEPVEIRNMYDAYYANIVTGEAETANSGYTGDGYANTTWGKGVYVEFPNVMVDEAADYTLIARYANGKDEAMTSDVIVNGENMGTLLFDPTPAWSDWETDSVIVSLTADTNVVQLVATQGGGVPNLDMIELFYYGETPVKADTAYYVSTTGSDSTGDGSQSNPWATIHKALNTAPLTGGYTIHVASGDYDGLIDCKRGFENMVTVQAETDYQSVLYRTIDNSVIYLHGAVKNITFKGLEIRGSGKPHTSNAPATWVYHLIFVESGEYIHFENNVIHDTYDKDLLTYSSGTAYSSVKGNIMYNATEGDSHIDINIGSHDCEVADNILFNDYAGSGRTKEDNNAFIIVKTSVDPTTTTSDIDIRRNIFMNFEGKNYHICQLGEDDNAAYEAEDILYENNLFLLNGNDDIKAVWGIRGCRRITMRANTIVGNNANPNFFGNYYKGPNNNNHTEDVWMYNNVICDYSGTMSRLIKSESSGYQDSTGDLDNNVYYNNGYSIPTNSADVFNYTDDSNRTVGDPQLSNPSNATVPRWNSTNFNGGYATVREAFLGLVDLYAKPGMGSAVVDAADNANMPLVDIRNVERTGIFDIGCYECDSTYTTAVDAEIKTPTNFALSQNYPNPFNPKTNIAFDIPETGNVKLEIFDIRGRKVATLGDGRKNAGSYIISWNVSDQIASGNYFYRIQYSSSNRKITETRKMLFLK